MTATLSEAHRQSPTKTRLAVDDVEVFIGEVLQNLVDVIFLVKPHEGIEKVTPAQKAFNKPFGGEDATKRQRHSNQATGHCLQHKMPYSHRRTYLFRSLRVMRPRPDLSRQ
jgi:hypothetical protein